MRYDKVTKKTFFSGKIDVNNILPSAQNSGIIK